MVGTKSADIPSMKSEFIAESEAEGATLFSGA